MDLVDLAGWTPARVRVEAGAPEVEWVYTGGERFTDPFFEQTIERVLRDPFSLLFRQRTPIETLSDAALIPGLEPRGFVFHVSRCGSTLVAQMLASCRRFLVLSEPSPVDAVLRAPVVRSTRVAWLRRLLSVLGRPPEREGALFVKFDSWSVLHLDLVAEAFPATPWIFLYRDPLEVLVSLLRHSGVHGVPGALPPELFGLAPAELPDLSREEYVARVLERICEAALAHADDPRGLFVDYRRLPGFVLDRLPRHLGLELAEAELQRMSEVARLDAKNPALRFEPRSATAVPPEVARVARQLAPLYERLEAAAC